MSENYSRVRMLTDAYRSENAHLGMVGYVIEIYPDGHYEIEFSNEDGITVAQIVARGDEIELHPEEVERLELGDSEGRMKKPLVTVTWLRALA